MRMTSYDWKRDAKPAPIQLPPDPSEERAPKHRPGTIQAAAQAHGVHRNSIYTFRNRHPELAHWTHDEVARQIAQNKDQGAVARRQGQSRQMDRRNGFGSIVYTNPPAGPARPTGESEDEPRE